MRTKCFSQFLFSIALTICPLSAGVIYQQPANYVPPNGADSGLSWPSTFSSVDGGFQTFDNFTLATGAAVGAVDWIGFYRDVDDANNVSVR
jgi:hypothetical protein